MPLFVVMTNLPGPGVGALIDEKLRELDDQIIGDVVNAAVLTAALKSAAEGASEFVELENEHGAGVGPSSGVTWHTENSFLSDKTLVKLGPFADPERVKALERVADAAAAYHRELGHHARMGDHEYAEGVDLREALAALKAPK